MTDGPELQKILEANADYAATFAEGHLSPPPSRRLAVVLCMDARIDPFEVLGLSVGDAHIIRNAGGRAADAIRSLAISHHLLGTQEFVIIHHTDCGMMKFTNAEIHESIGNELGPAAAEAATQIDFLAFESLDQSVREDVAVLRASPLIGDDVSISGFVYEVETGRLRRVI